MMKKRIYKAFGSQLYMEKQLLEQVKAHKKYKNLDNNLVIEEIKQYLKSNPKATINKQTIKDIRAKLHRLYSSYQTKKKKKAEDILDELTINLNNSGKLKEITNQLLSLTLSTKERLNDYQILYKQIFKITGKPKTIIDLGAGLNLLSYPLMNLSSLKYLSYDINNEDIKLLNKYFKIMKPRGLNGKASILDVRNINDIARLPNSDVVFMFKLIDLIDTKKKKISEELIKTLIKKTQFIVASFATQTLTRKSMKLPQRRGFELMLERIGLSFKTIKTSNEIFYVVFI